VSGVNALTCSGELTGREIKRMRLGTRTGRPSSSQRRRGGGEEEDDDDEGERGRKNGEKVVDVGKGKGKVHCMTCCRPFRVLVVPTTCATNFF